MYKLTLFENKIKFNNNKTTIIFYLYDNIIKKSHYNNNKKYKKTIIKLNKTNEYDIIIDETKFYNNMVFRINYNNFPSMIIKIIKEYNDGTTILISNGTIIKNKYFVASIYEKIKYISASINSIHHIKKYDKQNKKIISTTQTLFLFDFIINYRFCIED